MKDFLKVLFAYGMRALLFPLRLFPVDYSRLVFAGLTGGCEYEYSGSPKYICDYIRKNSPGSFQICWVVSAPERYRTRQREDILFVKHYSLRSFYYLMTAKVIVTSGSYAPWFPFRRAQYLINTWHGGGAYKRLKDNYDDAGWSSRRKLRICAENIDLFLSSCQKATELLFRGAFHYTGEVMEEGMPRNDRLVNGDTVAGREKVCARFGIPPEDKIALYAPTYRTPSEKVVLDADRLLAFLNEKGQRWHLLYRAHRYLQGDCGVCVTGEVQDASGYEDMQELLMAADILITDYSSSIWDYSFLERPCFLYVPDAEEYLENNGFYVDIHKWPFPMAKSQEELQRAIARTDMAQLKEAIAQHHRMMGNCESGQACRRAAERICRVCKKQLPRERENGKIKRKEKTQVLLSLRRGIRNEDKCVWRGSGRRDRQPHGKCGKTKTVYGDREKADHHSYD